MEINQDILKVLLTYNPETGKFIWNRRPREYFNTNKGFGVFNSRFPGKEAGHYWKKNDNLSYVIIKVLDKNCRAHRLAFLYMNGEWPSGDIDHIDGDGTNNKWSNLREVSKSYNSRNTKLRKDNSSGHSGVYWMHELRKWRVQLTINGERKHIGHFENKEVALEARNEAKVTNGYTTRHGGG